MRTRFTRQRGVAVVTALLLTTLAVTIVASLFWQQQVQVRTMENQRLQLQTRWILRGALDYARLILHSDGNFNRNATTLDQVWNTPLAETRLDQYIERERMEGESYDATLSGRIIDAASRYNLRSLADQGTVIPEEVAVFGNLLQGQGLDRALAQRVALAVAEVQLKPQPPAGQGTPAPVARRTSAGQPIGLATVDDLLAIDGFKPEAVDRLREFVTVLPERTKVNVNTAPAEVLAAVIGGSVGEGSALVASRKTASFRDMADFQSRAHGKGTVNAVTYAVWSEFFLVESRVRLDRAMLNAQALIHRKLNPVSARLVWIRQN